MLTGTTWKLSKLTFLGDDESPTESCEKDNTVNDSIDKKYLEKEGATKCNPADSDIIDEGTWAFSSNEKQLTITLDGDSQKLSIKSLTSSECKPGILINNYEVGEATIVI